MKAAARSPAIYLPTVYSCAGLKRETPPVQRYQIFYGQFFDWWQAAGIAGGLRRGQRVALKKLWRTLFHFPIYRVV